MQQELCKIISNKEVMPGIYHIKIETDKMAASARPGQYIMITCDRGTQRLLRRPISIFKIFQGGIELLYAVVGSGTQWLSQIKAGEYLDIIGPLGNGFEIMDSSSNLLLVAGGIGIAPLVYLAEKALKSGKKVTVLAGARTADLLCPSSLLPEHITLKTATEDGSAGFKGRVTELLPEYKNQFDQYFICGPLPMLKAIASNYSEMLGERPVQCSLEVRMGCGLGFCYACTIKTRQGLKQVCKDGPVFEMNDVIWPDFGLK